MLWKAAEYSWRQLSPDLSIHIKDFFLENNHGFTINEEIYIRNSNLGAKN